MKPFNVDKCECLADVFYAVIGGIPENIEEIKTFMNDSPLKVLFHTSDMDRILNYNGFFANEVIDAIYSLLPVKITLNPQKKWIMTPQAFRKLNYAEVNKPASRFVDVPLNKAISVYCVHFESKIEKVVSEIKIVEQKKKEKEQQEALRRQQEDEKRREIERKWLEHSKELQEQEELKRQKEAEEWQKEAARRPCAKYRQTHREKINLTRQQRRAQLKETNPELLKEMDKKNNAKADRKTICQRYYQKHKAEINQKSRENPMTKIYKQRYDQKMRIQKTGLIISSILRGLIISKQ